VRKPHHAAILTIGTELTSGQISNRNAGTFAERLSDLHCEVVLHETVPDDRPLMRSALDRCAEVAPLVIVTGGLGPTSDDFTRDVIGEWLGEPMEFHAPSWEHIVQRLSRFGIPVAESNRRQCYFPRGARVLENRDGTANGFACARASDGTQLWVFPGPPPEIESIWKSSDLDSAVRARLPDAKPTRLLTWQCLGKSESELGEITERALAGSGLVTGYRAHRPFVEIKVWCPEGELPAKRPYLDRLEAEIRPWVATRQGEDLALSLIRQLARVEEIEILDSATGGALAKRLGERLAHPDFEALGESVHLITEWGSPASPEEWVGHALEEAPSGIGSPAPHADYAGDDEAAESLLPGESLTLAVAGFTPTGAWALGLRQGLQVFTLSLVSPYLKPDLEGDALAQALARSRALAAELALKQWRDWLTRSEH
jgi:molybdenum cofactor synthesis domain-containing protein